MKAMFLSLFTLFALPIFVGDAQASNKNLCICQVDNRISKEVGFYKIGCSMWLNAQKCDERITVSIDRPLMDQIKPKYRGHNLNLGYVGHWSESIETEVFIKNKILPIAQELNMSVNYDNTACRAMENPELIQKMLNEVKLPEGKSITVKGNQAISIGLWNDLAFTHKPNFPSVASTKQKVPAFPLCSEFEDKRCMKAFQNQELARCIDMEKRPYEIVELRCDEDISERRVYDRDGFAGTERVVSQRWVRIADSFYSDFFTEFSSTRYVGVERFGGPTTLEYEGELITIQPHNYSYENRYYDERRSATR